MKLIYGGLSPFPGAAAMRTLADNTGIHAIGRSINKRAKNRGDALQLIQFCQEIIACDQIVVSGFEPTNTISETIDTQLALKKIGTVDGFIHINDFDGDLYASFCLDAGKAMLSLLESEIFCENLTKSVPDGPRRPAMDAASTNLSDLVPHAVLGANIGIGTSELREYVTRDKIGTVIYMIAATDGLIDKLREVAKKFKWELNNAEVINSLGRAIINCEIAAYKDSTYVPAMGRAASLKHYATCFDPYSVYNAEQFDGESKLSVDVSNRGRIIEYYTSDIFRKRHDTQKVFPTLLDSIIARSKGDPERLIIQSLEIRERLAPIRQDFTNIERKYGGKWTEEAEAEANDYFKRLASYAADAAGTIFLPKKMYSLNINLANLFSIKTLALSALGFGAASGFINEKELTAVLSGVAAFSANDVFQSVKYRKKAKILTEVASNRFLIRSEDSNYHLENLINNVLADK